VVVKGFALDVADHPFDDVLIGTLQHYLVHRVLVTQELCCLLIDPYIFNGVVVLFLLIYLHEYDFKHIQVVLFVATDFHNKWIILSAGRYGFSLPPFGGKAVFGGHLDDLGIALQFLFDHVV
jgi:hypothetical protein